MSFVLVYLQRKLVKSSPIWPAPLCKTPLKMVSSASACVCESAEADFGPLDVLYGARPYIGLGSLTESNLNPFYSC